MRTGAIVLVTALSLTTPGSLVLREAAGTEARLAALASTVERRRTIEPRLTGGFAWAPLPPAPIPTATANSGARGMGSLSEAWVIAGVMQREDDAHVLGVAHLLLDDVDEAVRLLERAAEERPQDGALLSDLAAALLERGTRERRGLDLVRALDWAERARRLLPDRAEPRFNAALALEKLGLHRASTKAWEECWRQDRDPAWAAEAQWRARRFVTAETAAWDDAAFARACAVSELDPVLALVRRYPQQAFARLVEELDRCTELCVAGDLAAKPSLDALARGARALTLILQDTLVERAADELASAARGGTGLQALARARGDLRRGLAAQDSLRTSEASVLLRRAAAGFGALDSPFRTVAQLYQLSAEFYLPRAPDYATRLEKLVREADTLGHRVFASRARWLLGLDLAVGGQAFRALPVFDGAAKQFRSLGFLSDATAVTALLASTWWTLGRADKAWDVRLSVFPDFDQVADTRRAKDLLSESATQAELDGHVFAALAVQEAAMQYASDQDTPVDRCEGFIWLARSAGRAGRSHLAGEALQQARSALGEVTDEAMKSRLAAELSLAEAHLELTDDPAAAIAAADRAARWLETVDKQNQLIECYLVRGRAREQYGQSAGALGDYILGLRTAEAQRARIEDLALRISFFDTVTELGRALVSLELERGNSTRALLLADRVRATTMPEEATWDVLSDADEDGSRILRLIPVDGAVLFFSLLDDRSVVWVLRRDGIRFLRLDATALEVARQVHAWRDAVAHRDESRASEVGSRLFAQLLAPLHRQLDSTSTVVVIPDGVLHLVSWGSLRDPVTGRRWIEEVAVGVAPSLRSLLPRKALTGPDHRGRVTLVGDPSFDSHVFPELPVLPAAAREIRELEEIYPNGIVLRGVDATPARFLEQAARSDVLHVATHAIVHRTDPNASALVLAPDGSSSEGRLTAERIRSCDLEDLDLVVLAACRTGDGPMSPSEGPQGLARAFLAAGARAVVVSLWDLPDEAGRRWSLGLHQHLARGRRISDAMRRVAEDCWHGPEPSVETCGAMQLITQEPLRLAGSGN